MHPPEPPVEKRLQLLLIGSESDAVSAAQTHADTLAAGEIVCIYPNAFLLLESKGYHVHLLSEWIADGEVETVIARAREAAKAWYCPIEAELTYRGVNLGHALQSYLFLTFMELIAADLALNRLVDQLRPTHIVCACQPVPALNLDAPAIPLALHILRSIGKAQGISVSQISPTPAAWSSLLKRAKKQAKVFVSRSPALERIAHALAQWIRQQPHPASAGKIPWTERMLHVAGFGEDYDAAVINTYLDMMRAAGNCQTALITDTLELATLRSGLHLDSGTPRFSLQAIRATSMPNRIAEARRTLASHRYSQADCQLIHKYALQPLMNTIWQWCYDLTQALDRYAALLDTSLDVICIDDLASPFMRALVRLAQQYGVASVAVPHGWMNWLEQFAFDGDWMLVWGEAFRQAMHPYCDPETRFEIIADPSLHRLYTEHREHPEQAGERAMQVAERLGLAPEKTTVVLLATGFNPSILSDLRPEAFSATWGAVFDLARHHPDAQFVAKTHPSKNYNAWLRAHTEETANLILCDRERLEDVLPLAALVVEMGKPGTATLLTLLFDKPLILCNYLAKIYRPVNAWLLTQPDLIVASSAEELNDLIEQALTSPPLLTPSSTLHQIFDLSAPPAEKIKVVVEQIGRLRGERASHVV